MKRIILAMTLPAVLATSTIFGSSLFPEDEPPSRNTCFDYALDSDETDSAYTVGVIVAATIVHLDYAVGSTGYNATNTATAPKEGSTINFDETPIVGIEGVTRMSNSDTGQIITLRVVHHNKEAVTTTVNALSDSNIKINDPLTETDNSTEYNSVGFSLANRNTCVGISLSGYSLQYMGYSLSSNFGLVGSYTEHVTTIAGTETAGNNDVNQQVSTQDTYAGGFAGGFDANLVVYSTDDGVFYVGTAFEATKEHAKHTGNVTHTKVDGVAGTSTFSNNTSPTKWSRVHSLSKSLYVGYSTIQGEEDTAFITLKVGLGSSVRYGGDVLHKTSDGTAGDISTMSLFGELSYTM